MKKQKNFLFAGLLICFALIMGNCSPDQDIDSAMGETTITRLSEENQADIPFENTEVLKSFSGDPKILDYETARKLALVEFVAAEFDADMNWEGFKMNPIPVVIYGFDNKPKYYDFIIVDAEEQAAGTVTVHARRAATTSIRSIYSGVKDYGSVLSKAGGVEASLFEDWRGRSYVGLRGKSGETPDVVINALTGETATEITEIEGEEIIKALLNDDFFARMTAPGDDDQSLTKEQLEAALFEALRNQTAQVEAFWDLINELLPEIESIEDEDEIIDSSGKFLGAIISRIVRTVSNMIFGVDTNRYYIDKYTSYTNTFGKSTYWCGPWVISYLVWVKDGYKGDTYNTTVTYTNKVLGFLFGGKPMPPGDLNKALKKVSEDRMSINTAAVLDNLRVYNYIKSSKKPAALLCEKNGQLHWKLAVGTRSTGNTFFQTYYFLLHDNGTTGGNQPGVKKKREDNNEYKTVEWWNTWFLVND